ncbi:MAG: ASPIC/UnbV domain-containing protein [Planctomycetota bacterium]|nr:ASPIC/UnbV domain-containing protein [Planctomycetota bacterium]
MASTVSEAEEQMESDVLLEESVGNEGYTARHSIQMFKEGRSFSGNERNKVFFGRPQGGFADLSALSGADSPMDGRSVAACDFDDDGDVDLFVHNIQREQHLLLRNDIQAQGDFVKVRLQATSGQYEAIGALVTLTASGGSTGGTATGGTATGGGACSQVLSRGAGFLSCQAPELIFGRGGARNARLTVRWPGGGLEDFGELKQGQRRVLLVEGSGKLASFPARPAPLPDPGPRGLKLSEGDTLPVLALRDGNGRASTLSVAADSGGAMTMVNLWGSRCSACVKELPQLASLAERGEQRVVLINTDPPAERERAEGVLARHGAGLTSYYIDLEPGAGKTGLVDIVDLERLPLPTTLVVAPDGRVDTIIRGAL